MKAAAQKRHRNTLREIKNNLEVILVRPMFWLGTYYTASRGVRRGDAADAAWPIPNE